MRLKISCAAVCLLLSIHLQAEEQASPVLISEFKVVMADVLKLMKADRRLPHDITDAQIKERIDGSISAYQKLKIFDVTPEQAKAFEEKRFDDKKNSDELKEMLAFLKSTKIDMPTTTVYAMNQLQAGELKGARLELCVRLVRMNVDTLKGLSGKQQGD